MIIALALLKIFVTPFVLKLIKNNRTQKQDIYNKKAARPHPITV